MKNLGKGISSVLLFIAFIFPGCTEKKQIKHRNDKIRTSKILNKNFEVIGKDRNLLHHLPDTIALRDTFKGYIIYKSEFDTLNVPNKEHYVDFYLAKTNSLSKDFKEFQTKKSDTFARIHDSLIIIYDITFDKRGDHLLEGYVKDYLFYDVGIDSVHFKTLENQVIYGVYVKEVFLTKKYPLKKEQSRIS